MADMTAKVDADVASFNVSFNAMMDVDLEREHALLTTREGEAQETLALLRTRMKRSNTPLQLQYATMRDLQKSNDVLQQTAIDTLQHDTSLEQHLSGLKCSSLFTYLYCKERLF